MQTDNKELYRLAALKTGKSEETYKEIGNLVFSELSKKMKNPESLILKVKGVGSWHLRRSRIEYFVENYIPKDEGAPILLRDENRKEIFEAFKKRIEDYKKFIELRNEIRTIRYARQKLIETSEDNMGKYQSGI